LATKSKSQKTSKPSFSIIIPNLNGQLYLSTCLYSLLSSLKQAHIKKFEIILVDNASTDNSVNLFSKLTQTHSSSIILNKKNHGFAKAVNQGAFKAKYKYIVVCNNDIKLHQDWFTNIQKNILANPNYSTYFGLVLNQDGTKIESVGLKYCWKGKAKNIGNKLIFNPKNIRKLKIENVKPIWGASASLVIYQKDVFLKLAGFDQDLATKRFLYPNLSLTTLAVPPAQKWVTLETLWMPKIGSISLLKTTHLLNSLNTFLKSSKKGSETYPALSNKPLKSTNLNPSGSYQSASLKPTAKFC